MNVVEECYRLTKQLHSMLHQPVEDEEREALIEKAASLLAEREPLLPGITPPFTHDEEQMGKQIIRLNTEIDQKMKLIKALIKRDMNSITNKKHKAQKYSNPYENFQTDGYFYDKKN
ncbi:flagellar protein FliT [Bacillus sp. SG-1]|uniref:flagellar protein FliT n=1 Tax=Bacillus sp. SG-1 TaxID=161544 RepID=UPI0001544D23|nr:flagellar protein FliT [Bacillus sp. SG-1]EDL63929.1 flagellar protein [Bacillus sp. SG-1]